MSDGSGTISIHAERHQISDTPRKQNEFSAQFRVKKNLNFFLAIKLRIVGDKSQNSFATEPTFNFCRPYRRVRTAKLTNHSVRTN